MVDSPLTDPSIPDENYLRQTEHRAVLQPGQPKVSYEAVGDENASSPAVSSNPAPITEYQPPAVQSTSMTPPLAAATSSTPPTATSTSQNKEFFPGIAKPVAEEYILEWTAPSRPFKPRSRQYFSSVLIIGLLISLILFFAGQVLPVAVVVAAVFLVYVLSVIPPGMVKHAVTTYGLRVENKLYYWEEVGRFWFSQKYGTDILHIEIAPFPGRLTLLLGDLPKVEIQGLLSEILIMEQPPLTLYEKAAAWLQEKIPLESE